MARVLVISSQVARGHVGLAAIVPALQGLGHEVIALPTVHEHLHAALDRLRAAGCGIQTIEPMRLSLEDRLVELLGESPRSES